MCREALTTFPSSLPYVVFHLSSRRPSTLMSSQQTFTSEVVSGCCSSKRLSKTNCHEKKNISSNNNINNNTINIYKNNNSQGTKECMKRAYGYKLPYTQLHSWNTSTTFLSTFFAGLASIYLAHSSPCLTNAFFPSHRPISP